MSPGLLSTAATVASRDVLLALRSKADIANALLFFVIVASLFPLAVGPEPGLLRAMGPGVLWVAALLASLLGLSRLLGGDYADGTLEQIALAPQPLGVLIAAKIAAHWLTSGLPLVLIAPLLGLQYDLAARPLLILIVSLLIGTPVLSLLGAIGAALTLGLRAASVLVPLLVLPLTVPVLIFGAGAVDAAASGLSVAPHLSLLVAVLAVAAFFAPWAAAAAVRIALE
jgi:heme exporter protein B